MISDQQRREVAARLRNNLVYMRDNREFYEYDLDAVECGNKTYRNIACSVERLANFEHGNYIHVCETLADLIDRPTCRNVSGHRDEFECSECRCKVELLTEVRNERGEIFRVPFMPKYCPGCSAEVVEDD